MSYHQAIDLLSNDDIALVLLHVLFSRYPLVIAIPVALHKRMKRRLPRRRRGLIVYASNLLASLFLDYLHLIPMSGVLKKFRCHLAQWIGSDDDLLYL